MFVEHVSAECICMLNINVCATGFVVHTYGTWYAPTIFWLGGSTSNLPGVSQAAAAFSQKPMMVAATVLETPTATALVIAIAVVIYFRYSTNNGRHK